MSLQTNNIYEFDDFRLDFAEKTLRKETSIIPLTPKVFETLLIFLENPGRLIEKDELMQKLWQDRFVEESNLTFNIKMLRKALGDNAQRPQFIETVQSRGYRFIAEVRRIEEVGENGRLGDTEGKTRLSLDSSPSFLPVSVSPRPRVSPSGTGAVVALADWRHETDETMPEELDEHIAKLELVPAKPVIKSRPKYLALVAAGLILGAIGLGYYFFYAGGDGEAIDSVAVLPFVNVSGDGNTEYLSEGISDSIINSLSRLPSVKVISLNSVLRYKGKEVDTQAVGRELNVGAVLIGRMTQLGDDVTISVELIDVSDNRRLWGDQYIRKMSDLLVVQGEIARHISDGLRLRLSGEQKKQLAKQYTDNAEAYQLYILGRHYYNKQTKEGFEKSLDFYNQAIEKDPNYALAYAGLAHTYYFMGNRGFLSAQESDPKVEWAARKALKIDNTLAEGHIFLGVSKYSNFDWEGSANELRQALELDPNSTLANMAFGNYLASVGRPGEAIPYAKRAVELDPISNPGLLAQSYFVARQYDKAIELFLKVLEKNPDKPSPHAYLGEVYVANAMHEKGVAVLQKAVTLDNSPERWDRHPMLAYAYAMAGRRDDALKILGEQKTLASQGYISPYNFAIIYTGLGDKDRAFEFLEKGYDQRTQLIYRIKSRPMFDSLRSDPRYAELLRKMNLTP
jgi:TolB-like protein/DNA-binding winged helix-turn-helix (wHTH) protein/Tfp pilus assembly protein PilF